MCKGKPEVEEYRGCVIPPAQICAQGAPHLKCHFVCLHLCTVTCNTTLPSAVGLEHPVCSVAGQGSACTPASLRSSPRCPTSFCLSDGDTLYVMLKRLKFFTQLCMLYSSSCVDGCIQALVLCLAGVLISPDVPLCYCTCTSRCSASPYALYTVLCMVHSPSSTAAYSCGHTRVLSLHQDAPNALPHELTLLSLLTSFKRG